MFAAHQSALSVSLYRACKGDETTYSPPLFSSFLSFNIASIASRYHVNDHVNYHDIEKKKI